MLSAIYPITSYGDIVYFNTENSIVQAGETVEISIFSTVITSEIRMDRISDTHGGTASNLWINPGYWMVDQGTLINSGNVLIEDVYTFETPVDPKVSGNLYTFDYLVPDVSYGTLITIFADSENGAVNYVGFAGTDDPDITPSSLVLTVVPEPATLALLGLGGLLIRRKRK